MLLNKTTLQIKRGKQKELYVKPTEEYHKWMGFQLNKMRHWKTVRNLSTERTTRRQPDHVYAKIPKFNISSHLEYAEDVDLFSDTKEEAKKI